MTGWTWWRGVDCALVSQPHEQHKAEEIRRVRLGPEGRGKLFEGGAIVLTGGGNSGGTGAVSVSLLYPLSELNPSRGISLIIFSHFLRHLKCLLFTTRTAWCSSSSREQEGLCFFTCLFILDVFRWQGRDCGGVCAPLLHLDYLWEQFDKNNLLQIWKQY